jgi:hypothetical protein
MIGAMVPKLGDFIVFEHAKGVQLSGEVVGREIGGTLSVRVHAATRTEDKYLEGSVVPVQPRQLTGAQWPST